MIPLPVHWKSPNFVCVCVSATAPNQIGCLIAQAGTSCINVMNTAPMGSAVAHMSIYSKNITVPLTSPLVLVFHSSSLSCTSVTQETMTEFSESTFFQLGSSLFAPPQLYRFNGHHTVIYESCAAGPMPFQITL